MSMLKIDTFTKSMKYDGKILKDGRKKFNGTVVKTLPSGKVTRLEYKKGLLQDSMLYDNGNVVSKSYKYDDINNLISVIKNGTEVFSKTIRHNIGLDYTCTETINNIISKTYDASKRILSYVISPKLLFGYVKYSGDLRIDTRYFLSHGVYKGNGIIGIKNHGGNSVLNNGDIDKIIVKNLKTNQTTLVNKNAHTYSAAIKDKKSGNSYTAEYTVDKNGKPIWHQIKNKEGETIFDRKTTYAPDGQVQREIFSECSGKWYTENNYAKNGNVILQRRLSKNGDLLQTIKRQYNDKNLLEKELTYGKNDKLKEEIIYKYDENKKLSSAETIYHSDFNPSRNIETYYPNGQVKTHTEFSAGEISEESYDLSGNLIKTSTKNNYDNQTHVDEYLYDKDNNKIKTIKKLDEKVLYTIEHSSKNTKTKMQDVSVYRDSSNELLGKEVLTINNKTEEYNAVYTDKNGHKISEEEFSKLIGDDIF